MKRTKQTKHTFKIESFFDARGAYTGIYCAMTGELLHHEGNEAKQAQEEEKQETEIINPNQLQLTF